MYVTNSACCSDPRYLCDRCKAAAGGLVVNSRGAATANCTPAVRSPRQASDLAHARTHWAVGMGRGLLANLGTPRQASDAAAGATMDAMAGHKHSEAGDPAAAAKSHERAAKAHEFLATVARSNGPEHRLSADRHDDAAAAHRKAASMHKASMSMAEDDDSDDDARAGKAEGSAADEQGGGSVEVGGYRKGYKGAGVNSEPTGNRRGDDDDWRSMVPPRMDYSDLTINGFGAPAPTRNAGTDDQYGAAPRVVKSPLQGFDDDEDPEPVSYVKTLADLLAKESRTNVTGDRPGDFPDGTATPEQRLRRGGSASSPASDARRTWDTANAARGDFVTNNFRTAEQFYAAGAQHLNARPTANRAGDDDWRDMVPQKMDYSDLTVNGFGAPRQAAAAAGAPVLNKSGLYEHVADRPDLAFPE
jgi:hypothetical protein